MKVTLMALPTSPTDCLGERAQLIKEMRETLTNAKKAGKELSAEEAQIHDEKMQRCADLKAEHDRLVGQTSTNKHRDRLSQLDQLEADLDNPASNRITSVQGGQRHEVSSYDDDVEEGPANTGTKRRRLQWNLGDRSRNGRPVTRNMDIGGRRATNEYRLWGRQQLVGNERTILGPDGRPINTLTTIQTADDTRAGYFVLPEQMTAEILRNVDDDVWIQQWARVTYLTNARTLGIRRRTAKANAFGWGTELSDATDNLENALKYGKRVLEPHYLTGAFRLSRDLIQMADINIESEIISEMMIDLREFLEESYMTGSGVSRPLGLLTASADGISTSRDFTFGTTGTTFNFNTIIKAKYTLKSRYKRNAFLVLHPDRVAELAMLRTDSGAGAGTGDYMWQPSRVANEPDVCCGVPVRESYFMPSATGSGNYFGLYGDFSYFRIIIAKDLEMQLLREMRARTNENEYLFRMKLDAAPVLEEAFLRFKYA